MCIFSLKSKTVQKMYWVLLILESSGGGFSDCFPLPKKETQIPEQDFQDPPGSLPNLTLFISHYHIAVPLSHDIYCTMLDVHIL